jgi:hypothetical protein
MLYIKIKIEININNDKLLEIICKHMGNKKGEGEGILLK